MIRKVFLALLFSQLFATHLQAQDSLTNKKEKKIVSVKSQVENKDFVFEARYAIPLGGQMRYLTDYYSLKIVHDSLIVYLPYFGRAYTAPMDPMNIAIDITSTNFEYTSKPLKKGGWDITIKPKDQPGVQVFNLSVYDNGKAYLNVTNTDRDPISYNGSLEEKK